MKHSTIVLTAIGAVLAVVAIGPDRIAQAQPAKGALAAFERVLEVMNNRFKDTKLVGEPDRDFATLLIAHHEDMIFLARTQLEHGADQQLRQLAQTIVDEQQKQIGAIKEWQVRGRQAGYRAMPDHPPRGPGPLDQRGQPAPAPAPQVQAAAPAQPEAVSHLPMVPGTVEDVNAGAAKITIDHGPIPNLDMDAMTMVFRAQDPALLKDLKAGDRIRFQADRVNGQVSVIRIQKAR
jgi:Cu/Ag efflux protein CusF